ncbi:MAG TPA: hypothetical protein VGJ91_22120 [Polyangiaceae bacterium]
MPNDQPSRTLEIRAFERLAVCLAAPLLVLSLTSCGGKANDRHTASGGESVGGETSTEPTANGGSSGLGSAGLADLGLAGGITVPVGGAPASRPDHCNGLSYSAPRITWSVIADNPPAPKGGAISNGTYHSTKREDFVGPGGSNSTIPNSVGRALVISASTGVSADLQITWQERGGELPLWIEQNQTIVVTGTSYAYTVTCTTDTQEALTAPGSVSFTATMDQLIRFYPITGGATRVETFERE